MNTLFGLFRRFLAFFASFCPQKLPTGKPQFEVFSEKLLSTYGFPVNDSFKNMLAQMIQHADPQSDRVAPRFFVKRMRKAQANEVAFYVMQDLKEKLKQEYEAEQKQKQLTKAQATAPLPEGNEIASAHPNNTVSIQRV